MDKDELLKKAETDEGLTVEEVIEYERLVKPEKQTFGKWGTIARQYLEEENVAKYWSLAGDLKEYLRGIDKAADELYETMYEKLSRDERYKRTGDFMEDLHRENQIKALIEEEIYNELIYVD